MADSPTHPQPASTLQDRAQWISLHHAREAALFALTGGWSGDDSEPAVAVFLASQSALHAWRAEGWAARRPRSVDPPSVEPSPPWAAALAVAGGLEHPVERLAVWTQVFAPAVLVGYRRHVACLLRPVDDGLARWLSIATTDLTAGWLDGADLLDSLMTDRATLDAVDAVRATVAREMRAS